MARCSPFIASLIFQEHQFLTMDSLVVRMRYKGVYQLCLTNTGIGECQILIFVPLNTKEEQHVLH